MELKLNKIATSENEANKVEKMIIIGAGPAGLSAALYAARAELSPLVITGISLGGQASLTHTIENYPGFPDGVGGAELGELFQKQAERFGARFEFDNVTEVNFTESPYVVKTYGNDYKAETVVISTGASPNYLGVPGEKDLTGKGVSYCGTCDGWFFKEKDIVVVGGGDSALEEGIFLTRFAKSVTIIHRRDQLRAGKILQTRAFNNPKIKFIWDSVVEKVNGSSAVESVLIKNVNSGSESTFPTDGVFVFIGHTPNTDLFKGQLAMDENGYLLVDSKMQTAVPGVYAAGEVMDSSFKQVVTSAGWGAAAAIQATKYLESKE
ncbi:MAG: thioredoxin-disulfide reductase [Chloroflexi bacterium HGW-Chloroflexi-3]|nr:MAG: thioredoxin-disulfide reductase [Chloroflexi bacterium HGW-Chloroflexi-3]